MSNFDNLKDKVSVAKKEYQTAKLALKKNPDDTKLQKILQNKKKILQTAKKVKIAYTTKRKGNNKGGSPAKKIKSDPEKYNPARFKTNTKCDTVCVVNVDRQISGESVRKYFGACGGVEKLHFPRNEATDKMCGHVFIKFFTQIGAVRAVKMSGKEGYEIYYSNNRDVKNWNWQNVPKNICYSFLKGYCSHGERCTFIHSRGECFDFTNGNCSRGSKCKFTHGDSRTKKVQSTKPKCFDFKKKGKCERGPDCRFSHE